MAVRNKRNGRDTQRIHKPRRGRRLQQTAIESPKKDRFLSVSQSDLFSCWLLATNINWTRFGVSPQEKRAEKGYTDYPLPSAVRDCVTSSTS